MKVKRGREKGEEREERVTTINALCRAEFARGVVTALTLS